MFDPVCVLSIWGITPGAGMEAEVVPGRLKRSSWMPLMLIRVIAIGLLAQQVLQEFPRRAVVQRVLQPTTSELSQVLSSLTGRVSVICRPEKIA